MIKKNLKTLIFTGIIILLPLIWGLCTYSSMPEQIPIHFNFVGEVDNYGPKWVVLLISPIVLLIQWVAAIEANIKSKKEEIKDKYISGMSWTCASAATAFGIVMYHCVNGNILTAQRLVPILVGIMFVVMGNLMPKQKKSRWVGLRIKWTLNDHDNWMKTHRFFGRVSILCGFAMTGLSFMKNLPVAYAIMFVLMLCAIFVPVIYSYVLSKKEKEKRSMTHHLTS
jgi:uncharacterized membrane protein